jgi:hypothetical protein
MSKTYLNRDEFNENAAENSGGLTGSKMVPNKQEITGKTLSGENTYQFYQLKPSILAAKFLRRLKAGGTDRENFGEVLAAEVSRALTDSEHVEIVPKVFLVNDKKNGQTLIASRYLKDVVGGNLDEFAKKIRDVELDGRHVKVTGNSESTKGNLGIGGDSDSDKLLRQDLARAIAVSALSGDHDVNPGNMMVKSDEEGKTRIARIDFGHAFNDLLNAPKIFGGRVRNNGNKILDFVNRETVSNINPFNRTPKLWRDYSGIIPSPEMAAAFKEMGESTNMDKGVKNAMASFEKLVEDLSQDPKANKKQLDHIKKSLITISNNVSETKIDSKLPIKEVLAKVSSNLDRFYKDGQEQMKQVGKLMDLQVKVDKFLDARNQRQDTKALEADMKATYEELSNTKGIGQKNNKAIEWIKNSKDKKAFKGNLQEFVDHRAKETKAIDRLTDLKLAPPSVKNDQISQNISKVIAPPVVTVPPTVKTVRFKEQVEEIRHSVQDKLPQAKQPLATEFKKTNVEKLDKKKIDVKIGEHRNKVKPSRSHTI